MKPSVFALLLQTGGRVLGTAGAAMVEERHAMAAAATPSKRRRRKKGGCTPCEAIARVEKSRELAHQGRVR